MDETMTRRAQLPADIAALVEELDGYAKLLRMLHPRQNEKSADLVDRTIAALRTLMRPVEDEEVRHAHDSLLAIAENEEPEVAEPLKHAAARLASLAREKARKQLAEERGGPAVAPAAA